MRSSTRILMMAPRYAPSVGGVEKHIERVASVLVSRGYQVTVLTLGHVPGLPNHEATNGVSIRRMPYRLAAIRPLRYLWFPLTMLRLQSGVIHFHDVTTLAWGLPVITVRLRRGVFITYHGYERDPVSAFWRVIRRLASWFVQGRMCIGSFIQRTYGVRCTLTSIGATDTHPAASNRTSGVVFVGRLEEDTGILDYLQALVQVRNRSGLQIALTVCGTGSLEEPIRNLAADQSLDVRLIGVAKNPLAAMAESRACLAAGYLSMLEAMSLGLPVIGIARTPLRMAYLKSMRETGAPISIQTSVEGIAREMVRVISNDSLRMSLARRGRAFAARMTWERMADLYVKLWSGGLNSER